MRANPNLYEINTGSWLEDLSARQGRLMKLGDVPDTEWDAIAGYGFDAVWLMGIWRRSAESRRLALADPNLRAGFDRALPGWKPEDVVGSPYSVAAYEPDERIGTWADVDRARQKLQARKMALFLDFVGNHTARDHVWTREHPEYYVQGRREDFEHDPGSFFEVEAATGGKAYLALARDPYFPPWTDAVQLNHFSPAMRAAEIGELKKIAGHCDGVRCDMAMLHLNDIFTRIWGALVRGMQPPATEFWQDVSVALPKLILIAEVYWGLEQRLLDLGFSFAYDKETYDAVRDMNPSAIRGRIGLPLRFQRSLTRFLENHDEKRCAEVFGDARLPAAATLMGTLPGMRLYHQGELEGRKISLPIALRTAAPEPKDERYAEFFCRLLKATREDAFHQGIWSPLPAIPLDDATASHLVAYEWRSAEVWKLIVVNAGNVAAQAVIPFAGRSLPAEKYAFRDALDDAVYERDGAELGRRGLFVRREAYSAHLFDVRPV